MLGEVFSIPVQQGLLVVGHEVEGAANLFAFPGLQPADAEVAVEALDHSLEEFLVGLEGDGHGPFAILAQTANQSVAWHQFAQGAWVDITALNGFWTPHLARGVAGLQSPGPGWHHGPFAIEVNEAMLKVVIGIGMIRRSHKSIDPDAGLCPVGRRFFLSRIAGGDFKGDGVVYRPDCVVHDDPVPQATLKPNEGLVR